MIDTISIQLRRDLAANWTALNPVLRSGELGIERDTGFAKLGDGATPWTSLLYWVPDPYLLALAGGVMAGKLAPAVYRLIDAPTISVDASKGNDFRVTITANRTMGAPANPSDGQLIMFDITQGPGGNFDMAWTSGPGGYSFGSGSAPGLSTAAGATDMVGFKLNMDKDRWCYTGTMPGF